MDDTKIATNLFDFRAGDCFGVFTNYKMYHSRSSKITSQVTLVMFLNNNVQLFREQSVLLEDSNILRR